MASAFIVPVITVNESYISVFSEQTFLEEQRGGMLLTDRIDAQNLRLRQSDIGYQTDWHIAGDPTLIVIQKGVLRIMLRNGDFRDFKSGDLFIARDYLPKEIEFDGAIHGHKTKIIGNESLSAIHIKLSY